MIPISAIIPSRDEGSRIHQTVRSLVSGRSSAFPLEVVVVDDASTDGSCAHLAEQIGPAPNFRVSVRRLDRWSGIPFSRNRGAEVASYPIFVITDANTIYPANWDAPIRQHFHPSRVLTGTIVDQETEARGYGLTLELPSMGVRWLATTQPFGGYVPVASCTCTVIDRQLFHYLGGYDETLPLYGAAEPEFSVRAWLSGYEIVNIPSLLVHHRFRPLKDRILFQEANVRVLLNNYLRFACYYLPQDELNRVVNYFAQIMGKSVEHCISELQDQGVWDRRLQLKTVHRKSFEWFAQRFKLTDTRVVPKAARTVSACPESWVPVVRQEDLARTLVVIPTFKQHHLTEALIKDISREPVGIVIIDNSGDYTPCKYEHVLRPGKNLGWLLANNMAINRGLRASWWERFVLLNNDMRLSAHFVAGLIWTEVTSGASIVAASYDGWWKVQRPPLIRDGDLLPADRFNPEPVYIPYGCCDGTCVSVHRRVFEQIGYLDFNSFGRFGWAATTDFCFRARDAGMTTAISRAAFANHLEGGRHTARALFGKEYETLAEAEGSLGMVKKWGPEWRELRSLPTTAPCVVYTAITGERDRLKDPLFVPPGWRFVCFTDSPRVSSKIWEVRPPIWSSPDGDPRRTARWHKINAHLLFPNNDVSIWADASVHATGDWRQLLWYLGSFGLASYRHYARDCLYSEARECLRLGLDDPALILQQLARYRAEGYPEHNGLCETTILVRRHCDPKMIQFAELWWDEVRRGSKRDQISVNYCAWRLGIPFGIVNDKIRASAWLVRARRQERGMAVTR